MKYTRTVIMAFCFLLLFWVSGIGFVLYCNGRGMSRNDDDGVVKNLLLFPPLGHYTFPDLD